MPSHSYPPPQSQVGVDVGIGVGCSDGAAVGSGEGTAVGSGEGGGELAEGALVGAWVGHAVPIELPVVTFQPEVTWLERAWTSSGTSEQSSFE